MLAGCAGRERAIPIDLEDVEQLPAPASRVSHAGPILRVAVASMISPSDTRLLYRELVDYIAQRLGRGLVLNQRRTYAEVNELLARGELDLVFLCSAPYVDAHEKLGARILAVPVVRGQTVYRSYIIVSAHSGINSLQRLQGKRFAFVDPMSNTGYLVPTYLLALRGESPDSFFGSYTYTFSHDNSIKAVAGGFADGAAVESLVYDYLQARDSDIIRRTRVIERSEPFGIPPVVVPSDIDPALEAKLRAVLLSMHKNPRGRTILEKLAIERFVPGDDAAYDGIREMRAFLKRNARQVPSSPRRQE